ncbi:MAG: hypothetical protein IAE82_17680 [Opitutaceae bacterium]|nr:hypothetical protein [Opitutaceae bacterium]
MAGLWATTCGRGQEADAAPSPAVAAEDAPAPSPAAGPSEERAGPAPRESPSPAEVATGASADPTAKPHWLERARLRFGDSIEGSARWFDGFFGETRYDETVTSTFGKASLHVGYKEYDGVRIRSRLRARIPLPNLDRRVNAIIGRGDPDEIIEDNNGYQNIIPTDDDDQWLAGLGYTPPWSKSGRISLSAGVHIDWPLDPYVQARYRIVHNFSENSLVRIKETVFWRDSEGLGSTTNVDLERRMGDDRLLRWSNMLKVSDDTEDLKYDSRVILYEKLSDIRAVSLTLGIRGETGAEVPVREYGGYITYRKLVYKEWLFGDIILGASGLREDEWSERKLAFYGGVGFEFFFGEPPSSITKIKYSK